MKEYLIRRMQNSVHNPPASYSASSTCINVHPECEEQTISMKFGSMLFDFFDSDESAVELN